MDEIWSGLKPVFEASTLPDFRAYSDVTVATGWGLPIKNGFPLLAERDGGGWMQSHIDFALAHVSLLGLGAKDVVVDRAFLVSFPGAFTYGHWFVDICPRLEIIDAYFGLADSKLIMPGPLPSWARPFLDAYGIVDGQIIPLNETDLFRVGRLYVPSFVRNSDYLPKFPHQSAFGRLRANAELATASGRRILVKHTPMTSHGQRRVLSNFPELELMLTEAGFETCIPADMTYQEQVLAFSSASVIVGEDASSLHNVVYSTNAQLFVVSDPDRKNLLHLSICNRTGNSCSYIAGNPTSESEFEVDLSRVREVMVDVLSARELGGAA